MSSAFPLKLKLKGMNVFTNLTVKMKSRTTREEAGKELDRIISEENIFSDYDWKIDGCPEGGIQELDSKLQDNIKTAIEAEDPDDTVFWDGMTASYELNVYNVSVKSDIETILKSPSREEAIKEIESLCDANNIFEGYSWEISNCSEGGINDPGPELQGQIIERIKGLENVADSIEEIA